LLYLASSVLAVILLILGCRGFFFFFFVLMTKRICLFIEGNIYIHFYNVLYSILHALILKNINEVF